MDRWKYFAIGHADHVFCNPLGEAKVDELIDLLDLPRGGRVLDIACGKAEFLVRVARRWSCGGVGVDLSPRFADDARTRLGAVGLEDRVELVQADGADYDGPRGAFDAAVCLGASWIWGGHAGTLRALARFARPGGLVVAGEPFWRREPHPDYLKANGLDAASFGSHPQNVATGREQGLLLLHALVSSEDEWDRYEGYQWRAAERYAQAHPDDPDGPELLRSVRRYRDAYLHWGRDTLGWAVYVFQRPAD